MTEGSTEVHPPLQIPPGMENQPRFNPDGAMRMVNMEMGAFGGGTVALLLQLYNPAVAHELNKTGKLEDNPISRLHANAVDGIKMIFGTWKDNQAIAAKVNDQHARIPAAMKQEHLAWVGATLIYGSILGYETFVGKLSDAKKDEYIKEGAKPLFQQLDLEPGSLPDSYEGLEEYIFGRIRSGRYRVTDEAKKLAPYVLLSQTLLPDVHASVEGGVKKSDLRRPRELLRRVTVDFKAPGEILMSPAKLITLGLMQQNEALDQVGREFGFQRLNAPQARVFDLFASGVRKAVPHLPGRIRYHKLARLAQKRDSQIEKAA